MPPIADWEHDEGRGCAQAVGAAVTGAPVGSGERCAQPLPGACSGERAQVPFTRRLNPKLSGRKASQNGIRCSAWGASGGLSKVRPFRSRPLTQVALRYWRIFRLVYLCTM